LVNICEVSLIFVISELKLIIIITMSNGKLLHTIDSSMIM